MNNLKCPLLETVCTQLHSVQVATRLILFSLILICKYHLKSLIFDRWVSFCMVMSYICMCYVLLYLVRPTAFSISIYDSTHYLQSFFTTCMSAISSWWVGLWPSVNMASGMWCNDNCPLLSVSNIRNTSKNSENKGNQHTYRLYLHISAPLVSVTCIHDTHIKGLIISTRTNNSELKSMIGIRLRISSTMDIHMNIRTDILLPRKVLRSKLNTLNELRSNPGSKRSNC